MFDLKAIKDSADVILKKKQKGGSKTVLMCDYANQTSFDIKADAIYATKKGIKAVKFDKPTEGTLKMEMEVMDLKWLPILLGSDFRDGVSNIFSPEKLTIKNNKVTLKDIPKVGTLEIFTLLSDNISHDKELMGESDNTLENTYKINDKDIEFNATSQPDGTKIVCYYVPSTVVKGKNFKVLSNPHKSYYEIYGSTMIKDEQSIDEYLHFYVPNGAPISDFKLTLDSNNIAKLEVTFELLEGIFPDTNEKGLVDFSFIE